MKTGQALTDYVTTTIRRDLATRAAKILAKVNDPGLDEFTLAIETALVLDHQRVSLSSIVDVLGELDHGDALRAIAVKLEATPRSPAAEIAKVWAARQRLAGTETPPAPQTASMSVAVAVASPVSGGTK